MEPIGPDSTEASLVHQGGRDGMVLLKDMVTIYVGGHLSTMEDNGDKID
jgi:hypothetical protein